MKRTRHTPEQVIAKLREADAMLAAGRSVGQVVQALGVSEATLHRWRQQYGGMKAGEARRLKELEVENARLKRLVAEQAVDASLHAEPVPRGFGRPGSGGLSGTLAASRSPFLPETLMQTGMVRCFVVVGALLAALPVQAQATAAEAPGAGDGAGLRGASAVLRGIEQAEAAAVEDRSGTLTLQSQPGELALSEALDRYRARSAELSPEASAAAWLDLFDAHVGRSRGRFRGWGPNTADPPTAFRMLAAAVPGPEAWPALHAQVLDRPAFREGGQPPLHELRLKLFTQFLVRDPAGMEKSAQAVLSRAQAVEPWHRPQVLESMAELMMWLRPTGGKSATVVQAIEQRIGSSERGEEVYDFQVPDLVGLVGEQRAAELLRRIVVLPVQDLYIEGGEATRALARDAAIERIDALPHPRWELVDSIHATTLYEALHARFVAPQAGPDGAAAAPQPQGGSLLARMFGLTRQPAASRYDQEWAQEARRQAWTYYVLGLVAQGRTDAAAEELRRAARAGDESLSLPYGALEELDAAGFTREVHALLRDLLAEDPERPLWDAYASVAVRAGHAQAMLELAESVFSERPDGLDPARARRILTNLYTAQLAAGEIEAAADTLMRLLPDGEHAGVEPGAGDGGGASFDGDTPPLDAAVRLATVGHLMDREAWYQAGITAAQRLLIARQPDAHGYDWRYEEALRAFVRLRVERGEFAEAEALLADRLGAQARQPRVPDGMGAWYTRLAGPPLPLLELAGVYHEAGRHADALALLEDAPQWGVADLAELYTEEVSEKHTLGSIAGAALLHAGRPEEAARIAGALIYERPGDDRGYQLLAEVRGTAAIPAFERAYERDRFQERPLIWKARVLLDQGRAVEAKAVAQQAIALDPSDGEQGAGDRMRAYAVLADAHRTLGDAEQAAFLDGVMRAIRLAERADRLEAAGMISDAVRLYEQSLDHFADAYCIQSRLALRLAELGLTREAVEHYRKAYELMPSSFGRVESHCFGCEGVFRSPRARGVAEEVFLTMRRDTPQDPRVHYLLGYLRDSQGRLPEAVESYRRAVELDPDYLSAWSELLDASERVRLSPAFRDRIIRRMLELDPLGRHTRARPETMHDAEAMWQAVAAADRFRVAPPEELLPLSASARAIAQQTDPAEADPFSEAEAVGSIPGWAWFDRDGYGTPGEVLGQHKVTEAVGQLLVE